MTLRTGLTAGFLHGSILTLLALALAACGGGGGSGGLGAPTPPDPDGAPLDGTMLRGGGSLISGSIDFQGDVDWYRFEGRPGVTYGLRTDTLNPPPATDERIAIVIVDTDGVSGYPNSVDTDLSAELMGVDGDFRRVWTTDLRGTYFIRISAFDPFEDNFGYRLVFTSSEDAIVQYDHFLDQTRFVNELDSDGLLIFSHEVDVNDLDVFPPRPTISMDYRFGDPNFEVERIFNGLFRNWAITLVGNMEPEEIAVHIHFGFPEVADSQPLNFNLPPPPQSFDPNINIQATPDDLHPVFFEIPTDGTLSEFPREVWHALIGHDTYIDYHVSTDFDVVPAPLTSTPPFGGFSFFESEFRLTGDQAVPPTGTEINDCTLLYLADLQAFQWDDERIEFGGLHLDRVDLDKQIPVVDPRPNPPLLLVGLPMNIRRGFPGTDGPIVLSLGNVVPAESDAGATGFDEDRDIKNLQHVLTNSELATLRSIVYSSRDTRTVTDVAGNLRDVTFMGWYIEIEDLMGDPVVRYDAALFRDRFLRGLEISSSDPAPAALKSLDRSAVTGTEHLGEVTFVTDYSAGGPVAVSVNDTLLSHLTAAFTGEVPLCGEGDRGETVRVLYEPGTYTYSAEAADGTRWEGTVDVASEGSCVTVALIESEAL